VLLTKPLGWLFVLGYSLIVSTTEQDILQTLIELGKAVASMPTAQPKPNLLPFFDRLDQLARELPSKSDPTLKHYLQRKSYEKARLWLEGRDAENQRGACA
jgi:hypothetical protein